MKFVTVYLLVATVIVTVVDSHNDTYLTKILKIENMSIFYGNDEEIVSKDVPKLPNDVPKLPNDFVYSDETSAYYKIHLKKTNYSNAKSTCNQYHGELISTDEQDIRMAQKIINSLVNFYKYYYISFVSKRSAHDDNCRAVNRRGDVKLTGCNGEIDSFVCKIDASSVHYHEPCKMYYFSNKKEDELEYIPNKALGSCYFMPHYALSWQEAEERCELDGGHLVVINSQREADFIRDFVREKNYTAISNSINLRYLHAGFLFSHRENGNRIFESVLGHTLAEEGYESWAPGEPNFKWEVEDCGTWDVYDSGLNDDECIDRHGFICEKEMHCECCTPHCLASAKKEV